MFDRHSAARLHPSFASASRPPLDSVERDRRVKLRQQRSARTITVDSADRGVWAARVRSDIAYSGQVGNYAIGEAFFFSNNLPTGDVFRSFFTFQLPRLKSGEKVVGATLRVTRFNSSAGSFAETFGLFDVSTSAQVLRSRLPIGVSPSIFGDLGTGKSYGRYSVSTIGNPFDLLSFRLNQTAVSNINRSPQRLFSIGGSIQSLGDAPVAIAENLFTFSNFSGAVQLVLNVRRS